MDASRKTPKIKSVSGGAISPIDTRLTADSTLIRYLRGGGSPIVSSSIGYRSGNDAFPSPISSSNSSRGSSSTFGRSSSSPLSAIENLISPPVYGTTPVKLVDEDVLIMDGFSVESSSGGRVSKSISSDSGGSSSNSASSSSPGIRGHKTELCRPWEDTGQCRSGSKCQYAHGKEEIRPYFFSVKNKSENYSPKSSTNAFSSYTPKSRFILPATSPSPSALPFRPEFKSQSQSPAIISNKNTGQICLRKSPNLIKPELSKKSPITNIKFQVWLPSDDGIEVRLPGHINIPSSNEDVDSYIRNFLHGPSNRRRLPVFTEFCPR